MLGLALAPLFDGGGPVIHGPPPPPPPALPAGLSLLVVALTGLAILWWLVRRFGRGAKHAARIGLFGVALGNALMDLAAVMQPDRPRVVEIVRLHEGRQAGSGATSAVEDSRREAARGRHNRPLE